MHEISGDEALKLPYISAVPTDGRAVPLSSFYDVTERDWHLYVPYQGKKLIRMRGGETVKGAYIAASAASSLDVEFPFATMILQHLSFPELLYASSKVEHYIWQLATVLEDYERSAAASAETGKGGGAELADANIEYLIILVRTIYDLLQKFIKASARSIVYLDGTNRRVMPELPARFSAIVLSRDSLRTPEEIQARYSLPAPMSRFFAGEAAHFRDIRRLRVSIVHHGNKLPTIFEHKKGLVVPFKEEPWCGFNVWNSSNTIEDRWGALRALIVWLAADVFRCTTRYTEAFLKSVSVPPALSPGNVVYLRHPFGERLSSADFVLSHPWDRGRDVA